MKLVNEKGKLFGLINVVDLVVLVVVLLLAAALVVKFVLPAASNVIAEDSEMVVTLRVRGVMDYMKDQIKTSVGSQLVAGSDYVSGTEVLSAEEVPYQAAANTDDGKFVTATDPQKYDIIITVKAEQAKGAAIYKIGNQEVRVGRGFIFKTQTVEQNAIIEKVEFNG